MSFAFNRRAILKALAALTAAGGGLWPAASSAQSGSRTATLQRIAWLLFPMEDLGDAPYARVAAAIAGDAANADLVTAGLGQLDAGSPGSWLGKTESDQLADLRAIESGPFFQHVLATTKGILFTDREVWDYLDYGGSSMQFGGYIDRGLNDIDWLEDA